MESGDFRTDHRSLLDNWRCSRFLGERATSRKPDRVLERALEPARQERDDGPAQLGAPDRVDVTLSEGGFRLGWAEARDRVEVEPERRGDGLIELTPRHSLFIADEKGLAIHAIGGERQPDRVNEIVDVDAVADAACAVDDVGGVVTQGVREVDDPPRPRAEDDRRTKNDELDGAPCPQTSKPSFGADFRVVVRERVANGQP